MSEPGNVEPPPRPWREGASWSRKGGLTTVVAEGTGPADERGRREDDVLVGTMATPELAALVVRAVNALAGHEGGSPSKEPDA